MASLIKRIKHSRRNAKNGKKADPQLHKEMIDSSKSSEKVDLPDEIPEEQGTDSNEENSQATCGGSGKHYGTVSEKITRDESSADDEKLLEDLPSGGYQILVELLEHRSVVGRDYKSLADKMGYSNEYIQHLGSTNQPVMNLMMKYRENSRKISELTSLLKQMERNDVIEELQPYIDATPTQSQKECHQQNLEKIEKLRTVHDRYDAYVCFAKEDRAFVEKMVKKLESRRYNLKLCLSERDFLGGGCYLETAAVAIERCKKFIAVLSSNFDDSDAANFESNVATYLTPSAKKDRYLPILIEDAYRHKIPKTIKHLYHLDYTRIDESTFWDRLADSLKS